MNKKRDAHRNDDPNRSVIRVPLKEETLEAHAVPTQLGSVLIHKRVETRAAVEEVDLHQDDVSVDREARDEVVAGREEPWYEGDTLVVPVYEETIVTETRLVLRELIRVTRTQRIERVAVEGDLRREIIDIEPVVDDQSSRTPEQHNR